MSGEEDKTEKKVEVVPDPDLDDLLNDAIQDFNKPPPAKPSAEAPSADLASAMAALGVGAAVSQGGGENNIWTEEFIQQATANFEKTMRTLMEQQEGAGDKKPEEVAPQPPPGEAPPLDLSSMSAEFAKFAEAATKTVSEAQPDTDFTQCLAETMQQLSQNNEQLQSVPTADDLNKMFENLGFGGAEGEGMGGLFPLMQVMLENILSKEVLYPPMKEITDKYPDWLADNRNSLPAEEFERYNKQFEVMKQLVQMYEEENETDSDEVKGQRFEKIMQHMQKLQEMGQPPKELVGDMGPVINFDAAGNPILPDMSTLLGAAGFPGGQDGAAQDPNAAPSDQQQPQAEQCSIM